ncbi:Uma2 family endonuclease [Leptolyngbya sp. FACHB-17]|uniref:Uma2 family endonuclease n=1 Tax=unclassified Leptolyngbya TaxID=2650499 RepID=UPI0016809971|nr:Uma2 family endonuclease [Leptolyngbya sp. FACHB-17]MBD2081874.1 Uma2 family endonuclease [Leptolyngbya sp. FACHB-17]
MNIIQIPTETWVAASWQEYLETIEQPAFEKAKSYYHDHRFRIEMPPLGHDHAADNTIANFAVTLFCTLKEIPAKGLNNCTFRKAGVREAQPDLAYYLNENAEIVPWGTTIIDLDRFPPPDLVIEIANTSLSDDQGEKRLLYEDLQVKEYWIFDVRNVRVLAFAIENQGSRRTTESTVLSNLPIALLQEALQRSRQQNQSQVGAWLLSEFNRL